MLRICIIEDDLYDLRKRYSFLAGSGRDVYVVIDNTGVSYTSERNLEEINEMGFDRTKVVFGLEQIPTSDIYFCDGLQGGWKFLDQAYDEKDKFVLCTTHPPFIPEAKERGVRWLDPLEDDFREKLEEIIGRI